uniref:MH1 domain-containing protein n=1 Tax=Glossina pallidipes TaxID=7398 RepID=A0A1A9ZIK6_GLOPL
MYCENFISEGFCTCHLCGHAFSIMSKEVCTDPYHYKRVEISDLPQILIKWYLESAPNHPMLDVNVMIEDIKRCPAAAKAETTYSQLRDASKQQDMPRNFSKYKQVKLQRLWVFLVPVTVVKTRSKL